MNSEEPKSKAWPVIVEPPRALCARCRAVLAENVQSYRAALWMTGEINAAMEKHSCMKHIRPWQLFALLGDDRTVEYEIPRHRGVESETTKSLETLILVAVARVCGVRTILELGTGLGYNAMHLARNTAASIVTVDKTAGEFVFRGYKQYRIMAVTQNIETFRPMPFDMVFCDVNYTLESTVRATEIAFGCKPKVVAWHDYGHADLPHVKLCLDRLAETHQLIHIEDSLTVLWFEDERL